MSQPSRALFLYIMYCKHVRMYGSTVICAALLSVYTINYDIRNAIQYHLALLYFFIEQRTLQGIEPETSMLIGQVYETS